MSINGNHRVLCVGAGNTGRSHILAYHRLDGFEIAGICTRSPESRNAVMDELGESYPGFNDYYKALKIKTGCGLYFNVSDTHYDYTKAALRRRRFQKSLLLRLSRKRRNW